MVASKAQKIVECVPNFSDGRRSEVLDAIARSIRAVEGVRLLSAEPDRDYNRSVVTFVGSPERVVEAAFCATREATERIDMRQQKGEPGIKDDKRIISGFIKNLPQGEI